MDSSLILTTSSDQCCYDPQVTDLENEVQRRKVICLRPHSLIPGLNYLSTVLFTEHLLCTAIVSHLHPSPQTVTLFYREGSGGSERLGNWAKVTQPGSGRGKIQPALPDSRKPLMAPKGKRDQLHHSSIYLFNHLLNKYLLSAYYVRHRVGHNKADPAPKLRGSQSCTRPWSAQTK